MTKGVFIDRQLNKYIPLEDENDEEGHQKCTGYFKNRRLYGLGIAYYANGETYKGLWKDGKRCGQG